MIKYLICFSPSYRSYSILYYNYMIWRQERLNLLALLDTVGASSDKGWNVCVVQWCNGNEFVKHFDFTILYLCFKHRQIRQMEDFMAMHAVIHLWAVREFH